MKKDGFEKCPSSISIAVKKVDNNIYFYVAVEIKDAEADSNDFKNHNKILDMPLFSNDFYYSGDNESYFNIGKNKALTKKIINSGIIKK